MKQLSYIYISQSSVKGSYSRDLAAGGSTGSGGLLRSILGTQWKCHVKPWHFANATLYLRVKNRKYKPFYYAEFLWCPGLPLDTKKLVPVCQHMCFYCQDHPCDVDMEHDDHTCYYCEQRLLSSAGDATTPGCAPHLWKHHKVAFKVLSWSVTFNSAVKVALKVLPLTVLESVYTFKWTLKCFTGTISPGCQSPWLVQHCIGNLPPPCHWELQLLVPDHLLDPYGGRRCWTFCMDPQCET